MNVEYTKPQKDAIKRIDKICIAAGIPTYTQIENHGSMLGVAALESMELGKQLIQKIDQLEAELALLKVPESEATN